MEQCERHRYQERRRFPPALLALMAAIAAPFLLVSFASGISRTRFYALALIPARFDATSAYHFAAWYDALGPLFGHVFLHAGLLHIGMNMLVLLQVGPGGGPARSVALLTLFFLPALGGALPTS